MSNALPQLPEKPVASRVLGANDFLELVRKNDKELLLRGTAARFDIKREWQHENYRYVPSSAASFIAHLPSKPSEYGSTHSLFSAVEEFIASQTRMKEDNAALLAFVAFSSYFGDCLSISPCLLLYGSPFPAVALLRLLAGICRHSVLSVNASTAGLDPELRPTRLICQVDAQVDRQLAALLFSDVHLFGTKPRQLSGTSFVYVGDAELNSVFADSCLQMWVSSATSEFAAREEHQAADTIERLQNQLLAYRLQNYSKVKASQFDGPEFSGATREYARSMGRCIVDAPELQARLIEVLRERDDAERTEGSSALAAVVIEALAVCCHERKASVHVGEVTKLVNGILTRDGEAIQLSYREVGARMKALGFRTTRLDASGRGIYLLKEECERVHNLGRELGSPIFREPLSGCAYCQG